MKRILLIVLVNLIIIGFIYTSYKYVEENTNDIPEGAEVTSIEEETEKEGQFYGQEYSRGEVQMTIEEGMSEELFGEVQQALSIIPPEVLKAFIKEGWKISIVSSIDTTHSQYEDEDILPQYADSFSNTKSNLVQIKNPNTTGIVKERMLHEMGHFADSYYGKASESDAFRKLYENYKSDYMEYRIANAEKGSITNDDIEYAASRDYEFFACVYKDYILYPDYVEERFPELSDYFFNLTK